MYDCVLRERKELLGMENEATLRAEIKYATMSFRKKHFKEARELYSGIIKKNEGDSRKHKTLLIAKNNYATCLHELK